MPEISDNENYKLAYQLDEMRTVSYTVVVGPCKGMHGVFVRVEHGSVAPFAPLVISMQ